MDLSLFQVCWTFFLHPLPSSVHDQNFEILKKYFSVDWKFAAAFFAVHSRKQEG